MKKFIYCLRDKKLGAYDVPQFKVEDVEHVVEQTIRGLKLMDEKDFGRARDMAYYYFGTFDDVTGKFELLEHEEKLLDFEDHLPRIEDVKHE